MTYPSDVGLLLPRARSARRMAVQLYRYGVWLYSAVALCCGAMLCFAKRWAGHEPSPQLSLLACPAGRSSTSRSASPRRWIWPSSSTRVRPCPAFSVKADLHSLRMRHALDLVTSSLQGQTLK